MYSGTKITIKREGSLLNGLTAKYLNPHGKHNGLCIVKMLEGALPDYPKGDEVIIRVDEMVTCDKCDGDGYTMVKDIAIGTERETCTLCKGNDNERPLRNPGTTRDIRPSNNHIRKSSKPK